MLYHGFDQLVREVGMRPPDKAQSTRRCDSSAASPVKQFLVQPLNIKPLQTELDVCSRAISLGSQFRGSQSRYAKASRALMVYISIS